MPSEILISFPGAGFAICLTASFAAFLNWPATSAKILLAGPEIPIPARRGRSSAAEVGKSIPKILVVPIFTFGKVKLKPSPQSPTVIPAPRPPAKERCERSMYWMRKRQRIDEDKKRPKKKRKKKRDRL